MECRSGEGAGGECREEVRWVKVGRCGGVMLRVVERRWKDSCEGALRPEAAVVGRVDGVDVVWRGEEGLEYAVQKVEVESVVSVDVVWV